MAWTIGMSCVVHYNRISLPVLLYQYLVYSPSLSNIEGWFGTVGAELVIGQSGQCTSVCRYQFIEDTLFYQNLMPWFFSVAYLSVLEGVYSRDLYYLGYIGR